jgi:hypothetical protein
MKRLVKLRMSLAILRLLLRMKSSQQLAGAQKPLERFKQRLSGGGNTQKLWAGLEFGSNRYKQFPSYSGRLGRGSRGWFIYPTLRRIQPELTKKWEDAADSIIKKWTA